MGAEDEPGLAFAEKLLAVLDSGRFTATYKFAVLIALIDTCTESVDPSGRPPARLSSRRVGERVLELMWRHALGYLTRDGYRDLRHSTQDNDLVAKITRFRRDHGLTDANVTPQRAGQLFPVPFGVLREDVIATVIRMPLPRLQRFVTGGRAAESRFLYDYHWTEAVTAAGIKAPHFDDGLYLMPGVGEWLVRLAGLLRPIVQQRWAAFVADRSADVVEVSQLDHFLFGSSRADLGDVREPLLVSQGHACFYCRRPVGPGDVQVDHFVPWSRHPDDGLDNLVATHSRCNNSKSRSLAASAHLDRWLHRFRPGTGDGSSVARLAAELAWPRRPGATLALARAAYLWLPTGTLLWAGAPDRYETADPAVVQRLIGAAALPAGPGTGHR